MRLPSFKKTDETTTVLSVTKDDESAVIKEIFSENMTSSAEKNQAPMNIKKEGKNHLHV